MRRIGALVAGLSLSAAVASAATVSVVSPGPVTPGTAVTVALNISGGEQIGGAQVLMLIGDGGPNLGGTDEPATAPRIIGGNIIGPGMVFETNNAGNQYANLDVGFGPEPLAALNGTITNTGTVAADGLLMTFDIDTSAALPGTYELNLNAENSTLIGAPLQLESGTLVIVPEPAAALLLIGALPFMRRRSA